MADGNEFMKNLFKLFEEIAKREKNKAIEASDYDEALLLAVVEGISREASLNLT